MKKILNFLLLFYVSLHASEFTLDDFNTLSPIKQRAITLTEYENVGNLYVVKGIKRTKRGNRPITLTVSKDLRYTFFGKTFDNNSGEKLYIKKDLSSFTSKANFTYGSGKDEYYLFTDPECPYCQKFEDRLLRADIKNRVKIYYYLYPLAFHKEAKPMSRYILSQKDNQSKLKAVHDVFVNNSDAYKNKIYSTAELDRLNKEIENVKKIVLEVGVQGTPALFKKDGTKLNVNNFLDNLAK